MVICFLCQKPFKELGSILTSPTDEKGSVDLKQFCKKCYYLILDFVMKLRNGDKADYEKFYSAVESLSRQIGSINGAIESINIAQGDIKTIVDEWNAMKGELQEKGFIEITEE